MEDEAISSKERVEQLQAQAQTQADTPSKKQKMDDASVSPPLTGHQLHVL